VYSGERTLISRNGKTVAALISYEDMKLLEEYEELLDIEALRKARAEDDGYRIGLDEYLAENPAD
jgi:prevent-host-death family protein